MYHFIIASTIQGQIYVYSSHEVWSDRMCQKNEKMLESRSPLPTPFLAHRVFLESLLDCLEADPLRWARIRRLVDGFYLHGRVEDEQVYSQLIRTCWEMNLLQLCTYPKDIHQGQRSKQILYLIRQACRTLTRKPSQSARAMVTHLLGMMMGTLSTSQKKKWGDSRLSFF